MELDDFKNMFNQRSNAAPNHQANEIQRMIRKNSGTALQRLLRNFLLESLLGMVVLVYLMWNIISDLNFWPATIAIVLIVVLVGYQTWLFYPIYTRLNRLSQRGPDHTRDWIDQVVDLLDVFIRNYRRFMLWGLPAGFVIGIVIGLLQHSNIRVEVDSVEGYFTWQFAMFVSVLVGMTLLMWGIAWLYVRTIMKRLYTRYYIELKGYQNELREMAEQ